MLFMKCYLRQVNLLLRSRIIKEPDRHLMRLIRTLSLSGIKVQMLQPADMEAQENGGLQGILQKEILWMVDSEKDVNRLLGWKQPILVCLHEKNREQDFSKAMYACEGLEGLDAEYLERVYRRFRKIPWDILDTNRCHLRETVEEDLDSFYQIYREPSITRHMENLYADREQELQYIRDYREKVYNFYGFGVWTVELKQTGEIIGRAGLSYREGFEEPELGFVIGVPWQGQGIATEVCEAVLEYGRTELGFDRIQALVEPGNEVSLHLCEKLGFWKKEKITLNNIPYWHCVFRYPKGFFQHAEPANIKKI